MQGTVALVALATLISTALGGEVDPCRRQPFRGRCPAANGGMQMRSQFVLRYYLRQNECVSYPFGHCAQDDNEPKLYRYKEECEEACLGNKKVPVTGKNSVDLVDRPTTETPRQTETTALPSPRTAPAQKPSKLSTTDCEKRRASGESGLVKGGYIPECDDSGDYRPLQCETEGRHSCFCVDKSGVEIPNSRDANGNKLDCKLISEADRPTSNDCSAKIEVGPCTGSLTRWNYDENQQKCKSFQYSGCGGNGNNYGSKFACERRCAPVFSAGKCEKGAEPLKTVDGAPVNCAKVQCPSGYKCSVEQQISVCCPVADSSKEAGALDSGVAADMCHLPKERGPCDRYELRFYYNSDLQECKYFFFGGCEGNQNNFEKVEDCNLACGRGRKASKIASPPPTRATPTTTVPTTKPIVTFASSTIRTTTARAKQITTESVVPEAEEEEPVKTSGKTETHKSSSSSRTSSSSSSSSSSVKKTQTVTSTKTTQHKTSVSGGLMERKLPSEDIKTSGSESETISASTKQPEATSEKPSATSTTEKTTRSPPPIEPLAPLVNAKDLDGPEVSPAISDNRCLHKLDRGSCKGQFVRWFWNSEKRSCDVFTYTGCGGTGNNFASREECAENCEVIVEPDLSDVCHHEIEAGGCRGNFERFAFDGNTGKCQSFVYGGCGGNGNNFGSLAECAKKCVAEDAKKLSTNVCEHAIEAGDCEGIFPRFAFDTKTNECRQFTYGGCGGTGNNFATLADCRSLCVKVKCPTEPRCDLKRCKLVNDAQGCPFCSCPPPEQPLPQEGHPVNGTDCPPLDVLLCAEPCIIFTNRRGCQECVCPVVPSTNAGGATNTIGGPVPPTNELPIASAGSAGRPPAPHSPPSPSGTKPDSDSDSLQQPPRQASVPTLKTQDKEPIGPDTQAENLVPHPMTPPPSPALGRLGEKCTQPVDPGPCKTMAVRWYFNMETQSCEQFNYGGCAGNRNHFFTKNECDIHCGRFAQPLVPGGEHAQSSSSQPTEGESERSGGLELVPRPAEHESIATELSKSSVDSHSPTAEQSGVSQQERANGLSDMRPMDAFRPMVVNSEWPTMNADEEGTAHARIAVAPIAHAHPAPQGHASTQSTVVIAESNDRTPLDSNTATTTPVQAPQEPASTIDALYPIKERIPTPTANQVLLPGTVFTDDSQVIVQLDGPTSQGTTASEVVDITMESTSGMTETAKANTGMPTAWQNHITASGSESSLSGSVQSSSSSKVANNAVIDEETHAGASFKEKTVAEPGIHESAAITEHIEETSAGIPNSDSARNINSEIRSPGDIRMASMDSHVVSSHSSDTNGSRSHLTSESHSRTETASSVASASSEIRRNMHKIQIETNNKSSLSSNAKSISQSQGEHSNVLPASSSEITNVPMPLPQDHSMTVNVNPGSERVVDITQGAGTITTLESVTATASSVTDGIHSSTPSQPVEEATSPVMSTVAHKESLTTTHEDELIATSADSQMNAVTSAPSVESTGRVTSENAHSSVGGEDIDQSMTPSRSSPPGSTVDSESAISDYTTMPTSSVPEIQESIYEQSQQSASSAISSSGRVDSRTDDSSSSKTTSEDGGDQNLTKSLLNVIHMMKPMHNARANRHRYRTSASRKSIKDSSISSSDSAASGQSSSVHTSVGNVEIAHIFNAAEKSNKPVVSEQRTNRISASRQSIKDSSISSSDSAASGQSSSVHTSVGNVEMAHIFNAAENSNKPVVSEQRTNAKTNSHEDERNQRIIAGSAGRVHSEKTRLEQHSSSINSLSSSHSHTKHSQSSAASRSRFVASNLNTASTSTQPAPSQHASGTESDVEVSPTTEAEQSPAPLPSTENTSPEATHTDAPESTLTTPSPTETSTETVTTTQPIPMEMTTFRAAEKSSQEQAVEEETVVETKETISNGGNEETINTISETIEETPETQFKSLIPVASVSNNAGNQDVPALVAETEPETTSTPQGAEAVTEASEINPTAQIVESVEIVEESTTPYAPQVEHTETPQETVAQAGTEGSEMRIEHPRKKIATSGDQGEVFGPPIQPTQGGEVAPQETTETCLLGPDVGPCVEYVPRWFFNSHTGNCEQFSYGSCGGNTNNFMDRATCEARCQSGSDTIKSQLPDRCTHEKDAGNGGGYNVKWYYNTKNLRCEQMVYQGSGGNDNQFSSLGDCQTSCVPVEGMGFGPKRHRGPTTAMPISTEKEEMTEEIVTETEQSTHKTAFHPKAIVTETFNEVDVTEEATQTQPIDTRKNKKIAHAEMSASSVEKQPSETAPDVEESIDSDSEYKARLIKEKASKEAEEDETLIAPSPPMNINYQKGSRLNKDEDTPVDEIGEQATSTDLEQVLSDIDGPSEDLGVPQRIPVCPNGLKVLQLRNGRPRTCLPGATQCPAKASCYFNGMNFYCCPEEEDPYDKHVFGGYNGDEERYGYKSLNIHSLADEKKRAKRAAIPVASFSLDPNPARIDGKLPRQYSRASLIRPATKSSPCLESVDSGTCNEAHLRFFYDRRADVCRLFYYSGCSGNSNNFATQHECEQLCKTGKKDLSQAPPGTCPGNHMPLGDNAPVLCGNQTDSIGCPVGYYCRTGPPDVCCPNDALAVENVVQSSKKSKTRRFKPRTNTPNNREQQITSMEESTPSPLATPPNMCPDGSDALLSRKTGKAVQCGSGYDGHSMCPIGFYCSIDSERNGRLCCPMGIHGSKIPPPPVLPPYFGRRSPNPGEVIDRGTLISDPKPPRVHATKPTKAIFVADAVAGSMDDDNESIDDGIEQSNDSAEGGQMVDEEDASQQGAPMPEGSLDAADSRDPEYGRMMLKPVGEQQQRINKAYYGSGMKSLNEDSDGVQIDIGDGEDPFDSEQLAKAKSAPDRSVCHLKPTEGRPCRENEAAPRTNLQYFYSRRDSKCKLYFYRGCGGNLNRFEKKRDCESLCMDV